MSLFDTSNNKLEVERNPIDQYVIFDVGKKSYLEPITVAGKNNFRVTVYNPDKFVHTHGPVCINTVLQKNYSLLIL
ncbi:MAG: hypothetical protein IPH61_01670 [Bacteroidetes bacterium]|nr:hypothetical protein [Bacteroidota bacterium]